MQVDEGRSIARCAIMMVVCGLALATANPVSAQEPDKQAAPAAHTKPGGKPAPSLPGGEPPPPAFTVEEVDDMLRQTAETAAKQAAEPAATEAAKKTISEKGKSDFLGISFGVGIAATLINRDSDARIDEAVTIGEPAVVRVTKRTRVPTRMLLESHYFFSLDDGHVGIGPFLAVQPGAGEIIEAVGFGAMLGFRRGDSSQSFNVGLGGLVDTSSPVLGDGFVENEPLPPGEMTIRLRRKSVFSWLALFSFSF